MQQINVSRYGPKIMPKNSAKFQNVYNEGYFMFKYKRINQILNIYYLIGSIDKTIFDWLFVEQHSVLNQCKDKIIDQLSDVETIVAESAITLHFNLDIDRCRKLRYTKNEQTHVLKLIFMYREYNLLIFRIENVFHPFVHGRIRLVYCHSQTVFLDDSHIFI